MKKASLITLIMILALSMALPVNAAITVKTAVGDNLFIEYDLNLDPQLYQQTKTSGLFNFTAIPQTITLILGQQNQTQVTWLPGPETSNFYDDANNTIHTSFVLGGSDIISFTINGTTMKRAYTLTTEWRKFQVNFTDTFSIDFAQRLAEPVSSWQKTNATTFFYESKLSDNPDISLYIVLPSSASSIRVQGETISYDMPARIEDRLLNSPFLILGALAVALVLVLIYRKVR